MIDRYVIYYGYELTIIRAWPYGHRNLFLCLALDPTVVLLWAYHVRMGSWLWQVGFSRAASIRRYAYNIWGIDAVLQVPRNSSDPTKEWLRDMLDHMDNSYD